MIATLIFSYGIYFYFNQDSILKKPALVHQTDMSSVDVDKVVNKYLQETTAQIAKEKYTAKKALEQALKEPVQITQKPEPLASEIPYERQVRKNEPSVTSYRDGVSNQIINETNVAQMDQANKAEYARQFIENARKGGYHIELAEDLTVIRITPIRKPSQDSIDQFEVLPSN